MAFSTFVATYTLRPVAIRALGLCCAITVLALIPSVSNVIADALSFCPAYEQESMIGCQYRYLDREHCATGGIPTHSKSGKSQ